MLALDTARQTRTPSWTPCRTMLTAFLINCAVAWALAPSTLLAPVPTTLACHRAVGLALSELKVTTFAPTASPSASGVSPLRQRLAQLARIAEEHGVAAPSVQFGHDASLVRWATRQRTLRRQGSLSQDAIDQLDAVSFVWDPLEHQWQLRYEELEAFFAAHGHSNVPSAYAPSPPLGTWVGRQRVLYRSDALPIRRRDALLALMNETMNSHAAPPTPSSPCTPPPSAATAADSSSARSVACDSCALRRSRRCASRSSRWRASSSRACRSAALADATASRFFSSGSSSTSVRRLLYSARAIIPL